MEMYYIEFLNKNKNFERDIKEFQGANALKNAIRWGKKNFYNFSIDMIKHK